MFLGNLLITYYAVSDGLIGLILQIQVLICISEWHSDKYIQCLVWQSRYDGLGPCDRLANSNQQPSLAACEQLGVVIMIPSRQPLNKITQAVAGVLSRPDQGW